MHAVAGLLAKTASPPGVLPCQIRCLPISPWSALFSELCCNKITASLQRGFTRRGSPVAQAQPPAQRHAPGCLHTSRRASHGGAAGAAASLPRRGAASLRLGQLALPAQHAPHEAHAQPVEAAPGQRQVQGGHVLPLVFVPHHQTRVGIDQQACARLWSRGRMGIAVVGRGLGADVAGRRWADVSL